MNYNQFLPERGLSLGTVIDLYGEPHIVINVEYNDYNPIENGKANFESFIESNKIKWYKCISFNGNGYNFVRPYEVKVIAKTVGEYFRNRLHNAVDKFKVV
jgi:hypothetical protein